MQIQEHLRSHYFLLQNCLLDIAHYDDDSRDGDDHDDDHHHVDDDDDDVKGETVNPDKNREQSFGSLSLRAKDV